MTPASLTRRAVTFFGVCLFVLGASGLFFLSSPKVTAEPLDVLGHLTTLETVGETAALKPNAPVMMMFWASWCPVCLGEMDDLERYAREAKARGVNLVTVVNPNFSGEMNKAAFKAWFSSQPHQAFPVYIDETAKLARHYQVPGFPSWVMVDKTGALAEFRLGAMADYQVQARLDRLEHAP